jgi:hypothetical protein
MNQKAMFKSMAFFMPMDDVQDEQVSREAGCRE